VLPGGAKTAEHPLNDGVVVEQVEVMRSAEHGDGGPRPVAALITAMVSRLSKGDAPGRLRRFERRLDPIDHTRTGLRNDPTHHEDQDCIHCREPTLVAQTVTR
jgi:hypothetical protein